MIDRNLVEYFNKATLLHKIKVYPHFVDFITKSLYTKNKSYIPTEKDKFIFPKDFNKIRYHVHNTNSIPHPYSGYNGFSVDKHAIVIDLVFYSSYNDLLSKSRDIILTIEDTVKDIYNEYRKIIKADLELDDTYTIEFKKIYNSNNPDDYILKPSSLSPTISKLNDSKMIDNIDPYMSILVTHNIDNKTKKYTFGDIDKFTSNTHIIPLFNHIDLTDEVMSDIVSCKVPFDHTTEYLYRATFDIFELFSSLTVVIKDKNGSEVLILEKINNTNKLKIIKKYSDFHLVKKFKENQKEILDDDTKMKIEMLEINMQDSRWKCRAAFDVLEMRMQPNTWSSIKELRTKLLPYMQEICKDDIYEWSSNEKCKTIWSLEYLNELPIIHFHDEIQMPFKFYNLPKVEPLCSYPLSIRYDIFYHFSTYKPFRLILKPFIDYESISFRRIFGWKSPMGCDVICIDGDNIEEKFNTLVDPYIESKHRLYPMFVAMKYIVIYEKGIYDHCINSIKGSVMEALLNIEVNALSGYRDQIAKLKNNYVSNFRSKIDKKSYDLKNMIVEGNFNYGQKINLSIVDLNI